MTQNPKEFLYEILGRTLEYSAGPDVLEALRKREDLNFESLELTSLHTVEVLMELEDELGVELDEGEFNDISKISDLVKLIETRQ